MNAKNKPNKLAEMTQQISGSLDFSSQPSGSSYEYSTAYLAPKAKQIIGKWKVTQHLVDDKPYSDVFCAGMFKDIPVTNVDYEATYEFSQGLCVKKVRIRAELDMSGTTSIFDYRMNVALSWELKPGSIQALPVLGYQYSSLDSKPAAVKDLPPSNAYINLSVAFEEDCMVLQDGNDYKKLERAEE